MEVEMIMNFLDHRLWVQIEYYLTGTTIEILKLIVKREILLLALSQFVQGKQ